MPTTADRWTGRIPVSYQHSSDIDAVIARETGPLTVSSHGDTAGSPYAPRFAQGATVVPRKLFVVTDRPAGPLGLPAGSRAVRSASSAYEKPPWKELPPLDGVVEKEFVRRLYLGETILPFRTRTPRLAVIPVEGDRLIDDTSDRLDFYPGLADWWRKADDLWRRNRSSDRLELAEQLDYRRKLSHQLPGAPVRVAYTASGMHLSAAMITDPHGIIEHSLYWAATETMEEARYLCAVLNSPKTTELVRPLMSYGKDERHIDKYVWQLPIPTYKSDDERHQQLAQLGHTAESEIAVLDLDESVHFPALRRRIRQHLATSSTGIAIDELVTELLS